MGRTRRWWGPGFWTGKNETEEQAEWLDDFPGKMPVASSEALVAPVWRLVLTSCSPGPCSAFSLPQRKSLLFPGRGKGAVTRSPRASFSRAFCAASLALGTHCAQLARGMELWPTGNTCVTLLTKYQLFTAICIGRQAGQWPMQGESVGEFGLEAESGSLRMGGSGVRVETRPPPFLCLFHDHIQRVKQAKPILGRKQPALDRQKLHGGRMTPLSVTLGMTPRGKAFTATGKKETLPSSNSLRTWAPGQWGGAQKGDTSPERLTRHLPF